MGPGIGVRAFPPIVYSYLRCIRALFMVIDDSLCMLTQYILVTPSDQLIGRRTNEHIIRHELTVANSTVQKIRDRICGLTDSMTL